MTEKDAVSHYLVTSGALAIIAIRVAIISAFIHFQNICLNVEKNELIKSFSTILIRKPVE